MWIPFCYNPTGDCGVPASPTNGTVAYTTTTEGSQATFQCSAGLVPGEVMTAVCENSGGGARWSPDPGDLSCVMSTMGQGMQKQTYCIHSYKVILTSYIAIGNVISSMLSCTVIKYCNDGITYIIYQQKLYYYNTHACIIVVAKYNCVTCTSYKRHIPTLEHTCSHHH